MDHLAVLREKIARLREEIADLQMLNAEYRRNGRNVSLMSVTTSSGCSRNEKWPPLSCRRSSWMLKESYAEYLEVTATESKLTQFCALVRCKNYLMSFPSC